MNENKIIQSNDIESRSRQSKLIPKDDRDELPTYRSVEINQSLRDDTVNLPQSVSKFQFQPKSLQKL